MKILKYLIEKKESNSSKTRHKTLRMKPRTLFYTAFILLCIASLSTSCKDQNSNTGKKEISSIAYQCPMNCEKGKSYSENTPCPVCKMDLKQIETTHQCTSGSTCKKEERSCCSLKTKCAVNKEKCKKKGCKKENCTNTEKRECTKHSKEHKSESKCTCADQKKCSCETEKCKCPKCPEHA